MCGSTLYRAAFVYGAHTTASGNSRGALLTVRSVFYMLMNNMSCVCCAYVQAALASMTEQLHSLQQALDQQTVTLQQLVSNCVVMHTLCAHLHTQLVSTAPSRERRFESKRVVICLRECSYSDDQWYCRLTTLPMQRLRLLLIALRIRMLPHTDWPYAAALARHKSRARHGA